MLSRGTRILGKFFGRNVLFEILCVNMEEHVSYICSLCY